MEWAKRSIKSDRILKMWFKALDVLKEVDEEGAVVIGECKLDTLTAREMAEELFDETIDRYMNMGAGQFLKDFQREKKIKKNEAHRKKEMEKAKKQEILRSKIPIEVIEKDESIGKVHAKTLVYTMISNNNDTVKAYKKKELCELFKLFKLPFKASYKKNELCELLINRIKNQPTTQTLSTNSNGSTTEGM